MKQLILSLLLSLSILSALADRLTYSINENWNFRKEADSDWQLVNIPHSWNTIDVQDEESGYYRGMAIYQRELNLDASNSDKQIYLYFEGVNQVAELFVNGHSAGKHIGGYTRFCFDITKFLHFGKPNQLEIKVDNSHNDNIPPYSADFTFFGGIYRDVYLVVTDKVHVSLTDHASSGVYIETPRVNEQQALVKITTLVDNKSQQSTSIILETSILNQSGERVWTTRKKHALNPEEQQEVLIEAKLENPILWSFENPCLYTAKTSILDAETEKQIDEVTNNFGIRYFEFDPEKGFSLNGKPTKLIGTNRHQDFKDRANALPDEFVLRDMRLLNDMGGNFLRVSHYPQDPTVLEYCDRNGIASSVEIPIVNRIAETDEFSANCQTMMTEMVKQNFNHPSVLIWAYMNEVLLRLPYPTSDPNYPTYTSNVTTLALSLENIARNLDPQRYTMISNHGDLKRYHNARLTQIPRLVGWNLYQGWYSGRINDFESVLESIHEQLPEKALFVTEFGPGVDERIRSEQPERFDFSVEYGQLVHEFYLKTIQSKPFVSGATIWNLNDFYSESRIDATPHVNNKGIVTTDRTPKDGYWFYKASLSSEPVIFIASRGLQNRSGVANKTENHSNQSITVFSNLPHAEFFLNGKSLGNQTFTDHVAKWIVPFADGENLLEVAGLKDGKTIKDVQRINFKLLPHSLSNPEFNFEDLNVSLGGNSSFFEKDPAIVWLSDRNWEEGSWGAFGGAFYRKKTRFGSLPTSDADIMGTGDDPIYQTQRVGIEGFRADIPNGTYAVSLYFAELVSPAAKEMSVYNLGNDAVTELAEERVFSIEINNQLMVKSLNLAADYGAERAIEKKFIVRAENNQGINIHFIPEKGEAVLNAIRIARKY
ncbi:glycoside hydrolase family 2 TIM barrel-domain containing protein [Mangrovibacterium sp.]|uniref:glycoside hydrolase family 2 TIM barrel-domain containing protein n=1 Tax=Mangrovibacterium sp. TaxID=1961364 RepID=UPI003565BDC6